MSQEQTFKLRGSLFTLTVLQLFEPNSPDFLAQLTNLVTRTPKFFSKAPIVIDLENVKNQTVDFKQLIEQLRANGLIPIAVKAGTAEQHELAYVSGLAVLSSTKTDEPVKTESSSKAKPENKKQIKASSTHTKLITKPVRSGQQIYAKGGDLVVISTVSQGSELLADGHIHVYGPLRGRALAGINGNPDARIFCHSLEAELIAIAGHYRVSDDLQESVPNQHTQIYLQDEQLQFEAME